MAKAYAAIVEHIRQLASAGTVGGLGDQELLRRYVHARDKTAFGVLLRRHGPMVWSAARRILSQAADADDVMQAVFLVLARDAKSLLKHPSLAGWLHETTCRIAKRARTRAIRRSRHEGQVPARPPADALAEITGRELLGLLDEELQRMPDKYRTPLVLCDLEGRTQDESARQVGCSVSTFKRRLERGRELLRSRLVRRGVTFPAAFLTTALTEKSGMASVPASLAAATLRAAVELAGGTPLRGGLSASVAALVDAAGTGTVVGWLKTAVLLVAAVGALSTGAGVWALLTPAARQPEAQEAHGSRRSPNVDEPKKREEPQKPRLDRYGDLLPEGVIARLGTLNLHAGRGRVGLSADGRTIVGVTGGLQVKSWDADTGKLLEERELPVQPSDAAYLSADGRILAIQEPAFPHGAIDIWDVTSGKRLRQLVLPKNQQIWRAVFTPDGKTLAVSENEQGAELIVRLWDIGSGKHRVLKGHKSSGDHLAFSFDGKLLATAHHGGGVICWSTVSGQSFWRADAHVEGLAFTPDGRALLASPSYSKGPWQCWDTATGKPQQAMKLPKGFIYSDLKVATDGWTLVFAQSRGVLGGDSRVHLWDLRSGKLLRILPTTGDIGPFSLDGKSLLTNDGTLQRWELATGRPLLPDVTAHGHQADVNRVVYSPNGRLIASAADDGTIRLWELATTKAVHVLRGQEWSETQLAFTSDGKRLVSVANDGELRVWDTRAGKEIRHLPLHDARLGENRQFVQRLHLTPDDQTAIVQGNDSRGDDDMEYTLTTWDLASGRRKTIAKSQLIDGFFTAISPDGLTLATRGQLLDPATGKTRLKLSGASEFPLAHVYAFSPDGRLVAGGSLSREEGTKVEVRIWEAASGQVLIRLPADHVGQLAFAPDGRYLATVDRKGIQLWDLVSGTVVARHQAHTRAPGYYGPSFASCLAYAPDGHTLATGHPDGTILIWGMTPPVRPLGADDFPRLWADLANADAGRAYQASWQLTDAPMETLRFLRKHLQPAVPAPAEETRQLLANLDSADFRAREDAARRLRALGDRAATALRETLKVGPSLEKRRRVEALLKSLEAPPSGDVLRELRAVAVVERMATRDAHAFLKELSGGDPGARLTQGASAALARMARQKAVR